MRTSRSQYYSQFDPRGLGGCLLWLDANDRTSFTLSGSNVTALSDKSGSGSSVTTFTGTVNWSSNGLNNRPTFDLSGGNFRGTLSSTTIASNYTHSTFIVTRLGTATGNGFPLLVLTQPETSFTVFYRPLDYSTTGPTFRTVSFFSTVAVNAIAAQTTSPFLWTEYYEGDQSNNSIVSLSNAANQASASAGAAPATSPGFFSVGTQWSSTDAWNRFQWPGTVSELIVYNNVLTAEHRQLVEGYLAWKWGLQTTNLPATHPYRFTYPFVRPLVPPDAGQCEYWFDAADVTTIAATGTTLTTWSNKGTNLGSNLTTAAGTLTTGSVAQQNGLNLVGMSGGAYGQITAAFPTQTRTRFFACRPTVDQASTTVLFLNQTGVANGRDTVVLDVGDGGRPTELAQGVAFRIVSSNTLANQSNVFGLYTFRNAATTARNRIAYTGSNMTLKTNTVATLYLTSSVTTHVGSNLDLGEWISYNTQLSNVNTLQVEGYLAWKWGLQASLPSNHLFRSVPPIMPAFVPSQISGCRLWLDSADPSTLTLSGSNVTAWADKSGAGHNATQTISNIYYPTYSNGAIQFNGTSSFLQISNPAIRPTNAYVVVQSSAATGHIYRKGRNSATDLETLLRYNTSNIETFYTNTVPTTASAVYSNGVTSNRVLLEATWNGALISLYTNGTLRASNTLTGTQRTATVECTDMRIGAEFSAASNTSAPTAGTLWTGSIFEMVMYSNALTTQQRYQIEGYLAWKWNLQTELPITHPYREVKP